VSARGGRQPLHQPCDPGAEDAVQQAYPRVARMLRPGGAHQPVQHSDRPDPRCGRRRGCRRGSGCRRGWRRGPRPLLRRGEPPAVSPRQDPPASRVGKAAGCGLHQRGALDRPRQVDRFAGPEDDRPLHGRRPQA